MFKSERFTENSVLPQHSWFCRQTSTFPVALRGEGSRRVHRITVLYMLKLHIIKVSKCILTDSGSPGESVTITVCGTEQETATLLASVLDGDHTAASLLARAIHQDPATIEAHTDGLKVPLNPSELGIWIDPIGEKLAACLSAAVKLESGASLRTVFLSLLIKMPPASTLRAARRCWRRVTCFLQVCTVLWS